MLISEVRAGKREGSVVSTRSFGTAAENSKETWDALRRELEDIGISPEIITEKRHFIVAWFQEAVAAGRLEEEAPSDEDVDSIDHCGSWSSRGNSDSNSVINQERPSHEIGREISKRSSTDVNNLDMSQLTIATKPAAESLRKPAKPAKPPKVEKKSRLSVSYLLSKLRSKEEQLLQAATGGYLERVRALLDDGADIEAMDKYRATALIIAAVHGHSQIVQLLLDSGANVNAKTEEDETALIHAAEHGHSQIVQLLLDSGANVNAKTASGMTALTHVAKNGHSQIVQLLLDSDANVNARTELGKTALYEAAKRDDTIDIVQTLLDNKADVNAFGTEYRPLIAAAEHDSMAALQLLIDRGADTEVTGGTGRMSPVGTALHQAVFYGKERSVKLLIQNGAAIEARNSDDDTVLIFAASRGSMNLVKLLLEKGANIEATGELGFTPLHNAAFFNEADIARVLLEYGAKTDSQDERGRTPLQLAEQKHSKAVIRVLRAAEEQRLNQLRNTSSN